MSSDVPDLFNVQMNPKPTTSNVVNDSESISSKVIENTGNTENTENIQYGGLRIEDGDDSKVVKNTKDITDIQENVQRGGIGSQFTSIDPFKESIPKQQIPQQRPKQQVQSKPSSSSSISKTTIILIVLIIILIVTIVILLIIKPFKAKHDYQTMRENYNTALEQAKNYQVKIQQLESDLAESTKANYESQQKLDAMTAMYNKKIAEDQFLIADGKNFNKKSPSYAEQRKQQYNKVANPNSEEKKEGAKNNDKESTIAIPKFKDVGEPEIEQQQFEVPMAQQQQEEQVQQQIPIQQPPPDDIDITDVY